MSDTNGKYNVAGDRPLGAAKPVDPATRLSELLAQSLEELTRPFDPPRVDPLMRAPSAAPSAPPANRPVDLDVGRHGGDLPVVTESRLDDKALAELEAELFAAASKPARTAEPPRAVETPPPAAPARAAELAEPAADPIPADLQEALETPDAPRRRVRADSEKLRDEPQVGPFVDRIEQPPPEEVATPVPLAPAAEPVSPPPVEDADTARVIAKVRRLMLISMAVTIIAVGSVFGFVGYRLFKGEGTVAKTADKVVPAPTAGSEMTLSLPRGARVVQSAVAEDRLIITLDIGGRLEVRTYDLKTLQPAGRLTFSTTP
jgi:hypothetical protein